jgi:acyl-CoA hydrolase
VVDPKPVSHSRVHKTEHVLPSDTNALGTAFGGVVVSWIDIAAAIAAQRHARRVVVTASIDKLDFVSSVRQGHIVELRAQVNYTGRTSMEVGVRVDSEDPLTGARAHAATAYLTFVALDEHGRPTPIPKVLPETEDDERRYAEAQERRRVRLASRRPQP